MGFLMGGFGDQISVVQLVVFDLQGIFSNGALPSVFRIACLHLGLDYSHAPYPELITAVLICFERTISQS